MSLTTILAIYAAIVSSICLGWNLYRELSGRARVKISVSLMRLATGADGRQFAVVPHLPTENANAAVHVVVKITNAGRRPVLLQGWGGEWKIPEKGKDKFVVISQGLPRMLKGHESHQEFTPDLSVVSPNIKALFVWDSSGRNWYVSDQELRQTVEQARQLVSAPEGVRKTKDDRIDVPLGDNHGLESLYLSPETLYLERPATLSKYTERLRAMSIVALSKPHSAPRQETKSSSVSNVEKRFRALSRYCKVSPLEISLRQTASKSGAVPSPVA